MPAKKSVYLGIVMPSGCGLGVVDLIPLSGKDVADPDEQARLMNWLKRALQKHLLTEKPCTQPSS